VSQLSFFTAGEQPGCPDDLNGLLCGPGQVVRRGGTARVSVVVDEQWRIDALRAALAELSLDGGTTPAEGGGTAVRTPFTPLLWDLAEGWGEAIKRPPSSLVLDGPRLRWWALAAGRRDPLGYVLGLGPQDDDTTWSSVGAALARSGLTATLLGPRADGPAYRVSGRRRLQRLVELLGPAPEGAPAEAWPSTAPS
jgi:hypothetical protein